MSENEIHLYGTVGFSFWEEEYFTAASVRADLEGRSGPLTVRINSAGGLAHEGQAIYTMLVDYPDQVHVIVDGVAMSAASLIAMAGDRVTMRLGAWMLIHDPAQWYIEGRGTEDEHRNTADMLAVISRAYADIYAKKAQIGRDEAREIMRVETVLDGPDAVQQGFADDYDGDTSAATAARFDYRFYKNAPRALREASEDLGESRDRKAVMAMIAGAPRMTMEKTMPKPTNGGPGAGAPTPTTAAAVSPMTSPPAAAEPGAASAPSMDRAEILREERERARRINAAAQHAGIDMSVAQKLIDDGTELGSALDQISAAWAGAGDSDTPMHGRPTTRITADGRERFVEGARLALMHKARLTGGERNEFTSMTMAELARQSLEMSGFRGNIRDRREMVGRALTMSGMHSTSDFAHVLADVAHKAALVGWEEAAETYPLWTRAGTLTDFKPSKRVGLGLFGSLPEIPDGAEYTYGTADDRAESIALATYGKIFAITRQAIINDDLMVIGDTPRKMGRASRRTIGNLVYAVLTGNPAMADGKSLFHGDHNNLADSAAALSVASLGAARGAMRVQKESAKEDAATLNIAPRFLIVPAAQETLARQLMTSTVDPTSGKGQATNPVANMAEIVVDGRLDANSTTAWYLSADPNAFDTIEVAYLDGADEPYLEEKQGWTVDGVEMKVRIDAGVAPLDYRTFYKNPGA
ncbi:ClpP-like prohead protease/major capsid protein fusion protein [Pseudoroseicyclus sp. CXY001]|uniref:ClpP-like prohead protease/major capsid protein fusion protein n=1 Tax=Pseudoroseicyclus sp. CXY001 TaxID=3242492 RepID=UPI0035715648